MKMAEGWIKLHRSLADHCLIKKPLISHLWILCLIEAYAFDKTEDFNGKPFLVKRGSFITSIRKLATKSGLSVQNIRTALNTLTNHKMIKKSTQELHGDATMITICNYSKYQDKKENNKNDANTPSTQCQHSANTDSTHSQHGINTALTTNKEREERKERKEREERKKKESNSAKEKRIKFYEKILKFFNSTCSTNYRPTSKGIRELINGRLNDGYKFEDFKTVISKKHIHWANDPEKCQYLTPYTLFRPTKFETYLNQKIPMTNNSNSIANSNMTPEEKKDFDAFRKQLDAV